MATTCRNVNEQMLVIQWEGLNDVLYAAWEFYQISNLAYFYGNSGS